MKKTRDDDPYDWSMTPAEKTARRQRLLKRRRLAAGLRRVAVWVPESRVQELLQTAAQWRGDVTTKSL
jgi:hypothetical protein